MKLYLAGPMANRPHLNKLAFGAAAACLRVQGHVVFNPSEADSGWGDYGTTPQFARREYMRRDLPILLECDGVALLPGWEESAGARLEATVATECGLPLFDATDLSPIPCPPKITLDLGTLSSPAV